MTKMTDEKIPRAYHSKRRSQQAAETKTSILLAADALFRSLGWEKTSIAAIARKAGVSAETIYSVFGSKHALIKQLVVNTVRRDQPDIPLVEQQKPATVFAALDQKEQIALFARDITDVLVRVAPLMEVVRTASAGNPELADLYSQLQSGRRENIARFVAALASNRPLRSPLDQKNATSNVWRLASPELFTLMAKTEGIDRGDYVDWLSQTLHVLLLP